LLFWYPTVTAANDDYVRPAVKIEAGAKSALDPNEELTIRPYVSDDLPRLPLAAENVTTVVAERTFWDKIIILHGARKWFEKRGVLRHQGQRVSRHYYDVHRMLQSGLRTKAAADHELAADCAAHARMFFNSPDLGLETATPGTFSLSPTHAMAEELRRDYTRMVGMIIGEAPRFEDVLESIAAFEKELNG
ncbi:MAG: nucleotidyl transferase AbiEii/AbiGii toxin family protein, partial [Gemmatimonadales bacterium]